MPAKKSNPGRASARDEIVISREFAAPRDLVFQAWTDPLHLAQWWGPRGFTNPVCDWDVRPGGKIQGVMRAPDGQEYPMGGKIIAVTSPEKLVFTAGALDAAGRLMFEFRHTLTFAARADKTRLTLRSRLIRTSPGARRYTQGFKAGMTQSWERLADLVEGRSVALVNTRVFDASRVKLFQAFRDPAKLARWWGPKGFTNTFQKFEFRPGGKWHLTMHGPDGNDYANVSRFTQIEAPRRIVFEHLRPGHWYRMTILLEECRDGTRLTWHMAFESVEECDRIRAFVVGANEENFDRLAALLTPPDPTPKHLPMKSPQKPAGQKLTITRMLSAPRALVFAAWTQSKHMKKWSAPHGFTMPVSTGSLRVGGRWRACMVSPQNEQLWLSGVYREVVKNKKLVFTHTWKGGDEETLVTVVLSDHPRGTKMVFTQSGFASPASRNGHKGGWSECFELLAAHLARLQAGSKLPAGKK